MTNFRIAGRLPAAAILASTLLLSAPAPVMAQADPDLTAVVDATVRVEAKSTGRSGTGWVLVAADKVNRAGAAVIVVPLNVVEGSSSIVVREPKTGKALDASIVQSDTERNLAFLEVKDIEAAAIPLAIVAPKVGGSIWGAGYNRSADEAETKQAADSTIKRGSVGREYRGPISTEARANVNQFELDAPMLPGFEGAPVVDACGRAIGMSMKSGMTPLPRRQMFISAGATSINALKSDEIYSAANTYSIKVAAAPAQTACTPGSSSAPVATDKAATDTASKSTAATPAAGGSMFSMADKGPLLALLALGLIIAAFGIYMLTRKKPVTDYGSPVPAPTPAPSRPVSEVLPEPESGTVLIQDARSGATTKEPELRLNGRGPAGEPIDLRFEAGALAAKSIVLGVGTNADAKIPDNRSDHKVSRLHARFGYDGKNFTVEDNKSLNGTSVGGKKIEPHSPQPLVNGDTISLADIDLKVSIL